MADRFLNIERAFPYAPERKLMKATTFHKVLSSEILDDRRYYEIQQLLQKKRAASFAGGSDSVCAR
jgi:hypothetical protein